MILALIFGFIILLFRRNRKENSFMKRFFLLPVSYLLGQLIIKGFTTSSYTATRDFYAMLLIMIAIYIASLMALNIISAYKMGKK